MQLRSIPSVLRRIFLTGFLANLTLVGGATEPSGLPATAETLRTGRWPAQWITHPAAPKSAYGVYLFRREIELAGKPAASWCM